MVKTLVDTKERQDSSCHSNMQWARAGSANRRSPQMTSGGARRFGRRCPDPFGLYTKKTYHYYLSCLYSSILYLSTTSCFIISCCCLFYTCRVYMSCRSCESCPFLTTPFNLSTCGSFLTFVYVCFVYVYVRTRNPHVNLL